MNKVTVECRGDRYILRRKLVHPEVINERMLNDMAAGHYPAFVPVIMQSNVLLETQVIGCSPLTQYFSVYSTRQHFLNVVSRVAMVIKECNSSLAHAESIDLDFNRVFVDITTGMVKLVYWPVVNVQNEGDIRTFFERLPSIVKPQRAEDIEFMNTYISYFKQNSVFTIPNFERFLSELAFWKSSNLRRGDLVYDRIGDQGGVPPQGTPPINNGMAPQGMPLRNTGMPPQGMPPRNTGMPPQGMPLRNTGMPPQGMPPRNTGMPPQGMPPRNTGMPPQGGQQHRNMGMAPQGGQQPMNMGMAQQNQTNIPGSMMKSAKQPCLVNTITGMRHVVDKPYFRIGRSSTSDCCIGGNKAVGRSHADILTKNGHYYIIDQDSTNKTFVNGQPIQPFIEVELVQNTSVRIANVDFRFEI